MGEKTTVGRQLGVLICCGAAFALWSVLVVALDAFGVEFFRARWHLLLGLGELVVVLALLAVTLAANVRARYVLPAQLVCIGLLGLSAGTGASLLFGKGDGPTVFDFAQTGPGMVVLLVVLVVTLRLLLRGQRRAPTWAHVVPWVIVAFPAARYLWFFRNLDLSSLVSLGLCLFFGLVLFYAVRIVFVKHLALFGWGAIVLVTGEVAAQLLGPSGVLEAPESLLWLVQHYFGLAGLVVLAYAALRYGEDAHG